MMGPRWTRHDGTRVYLWTVIAIVSVASGIAREGWAQQPQAGAGSTLTVTTQLVTLDVTVNDKAGHPVVDLGKSDFNVKENGMPQKVRYFEPPSAHRMPTPGEVVRSSADLAKIGDAPVSLLVLDEINTPFADMALARSALERYLKAQPDALSEPTALFFVDNNKLDVIQDYTQNKAAIQLALKKHFPTRGIRGRKNVVWVGKGFPSIDLTQADPDAARVITNAVKKTTFALLQSKVSLFTIDPAALDPTLIVDQESDSGMVAGDLVGTGLVYRGDIQFSAMAGSTGGHAFAMNNFIDQEIASSISDGANYYELSYTPTAFSVDPAKYRKISVTVARPGLSVITRDGYFAAEQPAATMQAESPAEEVDQVKFDLSTAALNKLSYNGLSVSAQKSATGDYSVSIVANGLEWREGGKGHVAELSMMAVCFSAKDKALFKTSSEHTASTSGDVTQVSGELIYKLPFTVPGGTTRIRFVVRDLGSGKMGSADVSVR